jgi:formate hydrogenlyase subunit 3/multisubunit Na+/H+ antiporter MnhD subunit
MDTTNKLMLVGCILLIVLPLAIAYFSYNRYKRKRKVQHWSLGNSRGTEYTSRSNWLWTMRICITVAVCAILFLFFWWLIRII